MENLLVSIITVCYNSENTIERTIRSVLFQTYKNIEYIIVDGKSTDNTMNIINRYKCMFENRITVISEQDEGIYDAMNKGIKMSHGYIVGIINSDDYYENNAVEKMIKYIPDKQYAVLYGETRYIRKGKEALIAIYSHEFLTEHMLGHPSCFVTKKTYDDYGTFDLKYKSVSDYDFMLRLKSKNILFIPIYEVIANFTEGGMSSTDKAYLELLKLKKNYGFLSVYEYNKIMIKHRIILFLLKIQNIIKRIYQKT